MFASEFKENRESMFESRKFTQDIEAEIQRALKNKKERFPDIITCPIQTCGTPVTVELKDDEAVLRCPHCGWSTVISAHSL